MPASAFIFWEASDVITSTYKNENGSFLNFESLPSSSKEYHLRQRSRKLYPKTQHSGETFEGMRTVNNR